MADGLTLVREPRPGEPEPYQIDLRYIDGPVPTLGPDGKQQDPDGEWTVTTPRNPRYFGISERVLFQRGRAVVYHRFLAEKFAVDYGYSVEGPPFRTDPRRTAPARARGDVGTFESDRKIARDPLTDGLVQPPSLAGLVPLPDREYLGPGGEVVVFGADGSIKSITPPTSGSVVAAATSPGPSVTSNEVGKEEPPA